MSKSVPLGETLQEIAAIIYNQSMDKSPLIYQNEEYKRLSEKTERIYRELSGSLFQEQAAILSNFIAVNMDTDCLYHEYEYQKGFADGLVTMQILILMLNQQPISTEIIHLLDQYYHHEPLTIDCAAGTRKLLELMKETVKEKRQLDSVVCDMFFPRSAVKATA